MADRAELVEAALEVDREGLALLDQTDRVVFWNGAAESITGYAGAQVLGRQIPGPLQVLTNCLVSELDDKNHPSVRGAVVHAQHRRGHDLPVMARRVVLRDGSANASGRQQYFTVPNRVWLSRMARVGLSRK